MGMMNVVNNVERDVVRNVVDEDEPTWDEAAAALAAAAPVDLVRSRRQIAVVYRYAGDMFTATSPQLPGFRITGRSVDETRARVRDDLAGFLDPAVQVVEHLPSTGPETCTATAGRSQLGVLSLPGLIVPSSGSGTARTYVSARRGSLRLTGQSR